MFSVNARIVLARTGQRPDDRSSIALDRRREPAFLRKGRGLDEGGPTTGPPFDSCLIGRLEVDRRVEAQEPRVQDRGRPQPPGTVGTEHLVERRARVGIEQVVEVDARRCCGSGRTAGSSRLACQRC